MTRTGIVHTTDHNGCEFSMAYEFDGDLTPVQYYQLGFEVQEVPAAIETRLVDLAYDDEREKSNGHEVYRDEATQ